MNNQSEGQGTNNTTLLENILSNIAKETQEKFYENIFASISVGDNYLKTEIITTVEGKTAPIWEELLFDEREKLNNSSSKSIADSKLLETEKENLIHELQIFTKKYSDAKSENETILLKTEKVQSEFSKTERVVAEIEKLLNDNLKLLKISESSLMKFIEIEKPKLVNEIETTFRAQNLLIDFEKKSNNDVLNKLKVIQEKETIVIQKILAKEIKIRDIEDEIRYFTQRTKILKSKKEKELNDNTTVDELDKKQNANLRTTVDETLSVVEIHKKLQPNDEPI